ncbi:chitin binding protein [Penicillium verhagenii]|uniref:chitin binding protein n=1 Tax=Penicillium verhagenii TaxID=1562060 RepID=UPI0025454A6D|nr:chitin binding protein [Penicillium verhagenii]KAJ5917288.1 chitin binding protein [Penicillium verhagenii]
MKQFTPLAALAGLIPLVHGHGFVTSPTPRYPGSAFEAACGQQAYDMETADIYGNVQTMLQVADTQSDYNAAECDAWLCKGFKYADNNVTYSYTAGETVDFEVTIQAPHTGVANVSVVDTSSNTVIGTPLISWSVYASVSTGVAANNTQFSVTIPDDLGDQCTTGGTCVLQWYWYAESIDQTYESCVDFTVDGSGSSSASTSTTSTTSAQTSSSTSVSSSISSTSSTSSSSSSSTVSTETPTSTESSTPVEFATSTETPAAVETTSSAAIAISASPETTSVSASTTFATQLRSSGSVATSTAVATSVTIPVNGSAEEKLSWVENVFKYLVGDN